MAREAKKKIDLTEYKKLCKAFLIMLIDANRKLGTEKVENILNVSIQFNVNKNYYWRAMHSIYDIRTTNLKSRNGRASKTSVCLQTPERCEMLAVKIKQLYPRISEIKEVDRRVTIEAGTVNAESIDWAESVTKASGVQVTKERLVRAYVVTKTKKEFWVGPEDSEELRAKDLAAWKKRINRSLPNGSKVKAAIEKYEVLDI